MYRSLNFKLSLLVAFLALFFAGCPNDAASTAMPLDAFVRKVSDSFVKNGAMSIGTDGECDAFPPSGIRKPARVPFKVQGWFQSRPGNVWARFYAPHGTRVGSAGEGIVIYAGWYGGYGKTVIINYRCGFTVMYGHLSKASVAQNEVIAPSKELGTVGNTGFARKTQLYIAVASKPSSLFSPHPVF